MVPPPGPLPIGRGEGEECHASRGARRGGVDDLAQERGVEHRAQIKRMVDGALLGFEHDLFVMAEARQDNPQQ